MTAMLTISILLAALVMGAVIWKCGVPDSVSAMVYTLSTPWEYLWTVWIWAVSLLMAPSLIEAIAPTWQFLGFLFTACMTFCGAMPLVPGSHNTAHNVLGVSAGVISQVCVLVISPWWLLLWLVMIALVLAVFAGFNENQTQRMCDGKGVLVAEITCYISLVGSIIV